MYYSKNRYFNYNENKKYIFIHIKKTAGTSFRAELEKNFKDYKYLQIRSQLELNQLVNKENIEKLLKEHEFISGHFDQIGQIINLKNYYVFMFFRNPLDRVISAYNHIKNDKEDPFQKYIVNKNFIEALNCQEIKDEMINSQFKYLIRNFGGDNHKDLEKEIMTNYNKEKHFPIILELLENIHFLGITEMYSTSLKLFEYDKNHNLTLEENTLNSKITSKGVKIHSLTSEEIAEIIRLNFIDLELYKASLIVFNKRLQSHIEILKKSKTNFQKFLSLFSN